MRKVHSDIWLCVDCTMFAVNGDTSGVENDKRVGKVVKGVEKLGMHLVPDFDTDAGEGHREFSACGCDACGTGLAGEMHRFAILG